MKNIGVWSFSRLYTATMQAQEVTLKGGHDQREHYVHGEVWDDLSLGYEIRDDLLHEQEAEQHRHRQVGLLASEWRQEH